MDKPKCKLCGERHYGMCPPRRIEGAKLVHTAPEGAHIALLSGEMAKLGVAVVVVPNETPYVVSADGTAAPIKPAFDRVAYQREYMREYMRKRRAAEKAQPA